MTPEQLAELQSKRNKLHDDMRAMLNAAPDGLDEKAEAKYATMEKEFLALGKQIEREQTMAGYTNMLNAPTTKPLMPAKSGNDDGDEAKARYEKAFVNLLKGKQNAEDGTILFQNAVHTGTDTEGGYLVPEDWTKEIFETLKDDSTIRQDITIKQTKTTTNMPIDGDDVEFEWLAELAEYPELQPHFGNKQLGAHKAGGVILVSREELNDSPYKVKELIVNKLRRAATNADDRGFTVGTGVDQPTGIVTATTLEVETAAAGGISYSDLLNMKYKIPAPHRQRAKWRASDAFLKAVDGLVDGNGRPIFIEGSIAKGSPSTLLGFPIVPDPYLDDDLASGKHPAIFGNFRAYVGADRGDIYIQVLAEKYATKGAIGILADKRTDGDLADVTALAKLKMK